MIRKYCLLVFLTFSLGMLFGQHNEDRQVSIANFKKDVFYLSSDTLKGRFPGTKGINEAAKYIAGRFHSYGLELYNKNGLQEFSMVTGVHLGDTNIFLFPGSNALINNDFKPFAFSGSGKLKASVVFAGYGFDIHQDTINWNDYQSVNVRGRWVLLLRGEPFCDSTKSPYRNFASDRDKALLAKDKGAAGVILVSTEEFDKNDDLISLRNFEGSLGIPVVHLRRRLADTLLLTYHTSISKMVKQLHKQLNNASFELGTMVECNLSVKETKVKTQNVVAILRSRNKKNDQYIVIGAHYDHLGMGGKFSSSRTPDTIAVHHGADDNASGVAATIELARRLALEKKSLKRNIVFVLFSGEEEGLLGSKYFVDHSPVSLKKIQTMINLDMVGRMKPDSSLEVAGTGTARNAEKLLRQISIGKPVKLGFSPEGYGASDHSSFYAKNIPVFFFTTGVHMDYHTPGDMPNKINYLGMTYCNEYVFALAKTLATMDSTLTFSEAGPKVSLSTGRRYKVTLGIMPDFSSTDNKGLRAQLVIPGRPADKGGMKKGDLIISINGKTVSNIQDYMARLSQLKAGEPAMVKVIREGMEVDLIINL
jgi:aminopeptidase YwaD